jgi:hypothetical protein
VAPSFANADFVNEIYAYMEEEEWGERFGSQEE